MIIIIKLMQEKVKVWQNSIPKNIFQILQKIQNVHFTVKISFFALCHVRWNDVAHQAAQ